MEVSKANFSIGKSLHTLFLQNQLLPFKARTAQAQLNTSELKQQLWQGIIEITPLLLDCGYASRNELEELILSLKEFSNNSKSKVSYLECTQIAASMKPL